MKKEQNTKTIPAWKSFQYNEIREITEYRDGCVFKTKFKGFADNTYELAENEVACSISTSMTKGKEEIELKPFLEKE